LLLTDPLLPPAEWPGVRAAYRFAPPSADAPPSLVLSFVFDPARVTGGGAAPEDGDGAKQRAREALLRYATAAAQIADPGTAVAVTQSVLPADGGRVGDGAAIRGELAAFAGQAVAQLQAVLADGAAAPVSVEIVIGLDPTGLARRADDLFPVAVSLALSRPPERVHPRALARSPETVSAAMPVPPDLGPVPGGAGLARFAAGFEAAFAGFDGAGGTARLAVRHGPPGAPGLLGSTVPWGVRWSAAHGIHVAFPGGDAPCFAPAPLGNGLVDGTARVPTLDPVTLEATYADQAFAGIDLDDWARAYLAAVDEVLSPAVAAAIAVLDGATYRALADAGSRLAQALAGGLVPVFPSLPGDAAAARERLERGALAALAPAFDVSSVVQVPAEVAVAGAAAPGSAAPRLCGSVGEPEADGTAGRGLAPREGALPVRPDTPESPGFLTFAATAAEPGRAASLELDPRFRARFVELPSGAPGEAYVHATPERLRFVLDTPGDAPAPPGTVSVPVPVRARPAPPVLREQRAEQAPADDPGSDAGAPLLWDYSVTLARAGDAAQDDLWVSVAWNLPLDGPGPRAPLPSPEPDLARPLFEALASFATAWPALRPHVAALPGALAGDRDGSPAPARVLAALLEQVEPVARAWGALRGTGDGGARPLDAAPAVEAPPPAGDAYVVSFADAFTTGVLRVFARAGEADGPCDPAGIVWPRVDGRANGEVARAAAGAPDGSGCWFTADYPLAPRSEQPAGTLELTWPRLDASARQTASAACWTVRNARLRSGTETGPELVLRTAPASFPAPVVPAIVVPRRTFPAGAALAATLEEALRPFAAAGTAAGRDRLLDVAVTYRFQVEAPEADGDVPEVGGEAPWIEVPVLRVRDVLLAPASAAHPDAALALHELAGRLAGDVDAWHASAAPTTTAARLGLDVSLRADGEEAQVPLLRAPDLEIEVPAGWWTH
jgi:hypothetical protein